MIRTRITAAVMTLGLALAGAAAAVPASAATTTHTAAGTWKITYGAPAVVRIRESHRVYTETAKTPVRVVGASCSLRPGTVIATFHSTGHRNYAGRHGLWYPSNCAFAYRTGMKLHLSRSGRYLTGTLATGYVLRFTRTSR